MQNPFSQRAASLAGPATDIQPVIPADDNDLSVFGLSIYVEIGGTIMFDTIAGETRTVEMTDFSILPVGVRRVRATGTTATGIHVLVLA